MDNTISQEGFPALDDLEPKQDNTQLTLFSLVGITVSNSKTLEVLQEQLKTAKQMYDDVLASSDSYRQATDKVKEVEKEKRQAKSQVEAQPGVKEQLYKIKEIKNEIKEKKEAISDYALEVVKLSGDTQFEKDGETYEVKTVAKLIKRKL